MKDYFLVGELAKLFDISSDTLRHYDKLGLLKPDYACDNRYRYYSVRSLLKLSRILFFKNLDIGLSEIRGYMRHKNRAILMEMLSKKSAEIDEKLHRLNNLKYKIDTKLALIQSADSTVSQVEIKFFKHRQGVFLNVNDLRSESEIKQAFVSVERYLKTSSWLVEGQIYTSVALKALMEGHYTQFRYFVEVASLDQEICPLLTVIPEGLYACVTFIGPYSKMPEEYGKLIHWIKENDYVIVGDSIEKNIVDYDFADSEEEYISEIQLPIAKNLMCT